jgi:hypothetical protein
MEGIRYVVHSLENKSMFPFQEVCEYYRAIARIGGGDNVVPAKTAEHHTVAVAVNCWDSLPLRRVLCGDAHEVGAPVTRHPSHTIAGSKHGHDVWLLGIQLHIKLLQQKK